jgi:hypothetical protein
VPTAGVLVWAIKLVIAAMPRLEIKIHFAVDAQNCINVIGVC